MDLAPPVKPEYGPSLPELLRTRLSRRGRVALGAAAIAVAAVVLVVALRPRPAGATHYVHRGAPAFNLRWAKGPRLQPVRTPPGAYLALEARRHGRFLQSFVAAPLRLPAYRGSSTGFLPIFVAHREAELARRYRGFVPLDEGKARINEATGYQLGFRAVVRGRPVFGREAYMLPDGPHPRVGVVLTALQTPRAGAKTADDVGTVGALRIPYRSFRFGTTWP